VKLEQIRRNPPRQRVPMVFVAESWLEYVILRVLLVVFV